MSKSHNILLKRQLLFDTGSQRSFVAESMRRKLELPTLRKESIFRTFGENDNHVQEVDILKVKMKCTNGRSIFVKAFYFDVGIEK